MTPFRLPPQDREAEASLLGAMLLDQDRIGPVLEIIPPGRSASLYDPAHRLIFDALVWMITSGVKIDIITLEDRLRFMGALDEIGGRQYLIDLSESVPSTANAEHYARIVREKARLRDLLQAGSEIVTACYKHDADCDDIIRNAGKWIEAAANYGGGGQLRSVGNVATEVIGAINRGELDEGIPTGIQCIDDKIVGMQAGQLIIVGARPSVGKTALSLQILNHVGSRLNEPCALISLEMGAAELVRRMISAKTKIATKKLRMVGRLYSEDFDAINKTGLEEVNHVYLDDRPVESCAELKARCNRMVQVYGCKLIMIDYLQLMSDGSAAKQNRNIEIGALSRACKVIAMDNKIPMVVAAQLNRLSDKENRPPVLSDLRDSGEIEQHADIVLMPHRPAKQVWSDATEEIHLYIRKHRNGELGVKPLIYHKPSMTFEPKPDTATESAIDYSRKDVA